MGIDSLIPQLKSIVFHRLKLIFDSWCRTIQNKPSQKCEGFVVYGTSNLWERACSR